MDRPQIRPPFRPTELQSLLSHVAYEVLMLKHAREVWAAKRDRHAFESLLLHARNLREFLFARIEEQGRDAAKAVLATDYVPDWDVGKGDQQYKVLWATKAALDAQLAHLSRGRADLAVQRNFDEETEPIAAAILTAWEAFVSAVSHSQWSAMLDSAMSGKRKELGLLEAGAT